MVTVTCKFPITVPNKLHIQDFDLPPSTAAFSTSRFNFPIDALSQSNSLCANRSLRARASPVFLSTPSLFEALVASPPRASVASSISTRVASTNTRSISTTTGSCPSFVHGTFSLSDPITPASSVTGALSARNASLFNCTFRSNTSPLSALTRSFSASTCSQYCPSALFNASARSDSNIAAPRATLCGINRDCLLFNCFRRQPTRRHKVLRKARRRTRMNESLRAKARLFE